MLTRQRPSWCAALAVFAATLAALATAPSARAESTTCTGTIGPQQTIVGNVVVPAGARCALLNSEVNGSVFVHPSASLQLRMSCGPDGPFDCMGSTVSGNVVASRASVVGLEMSRVEGNVVVDNTDYIYLYRSDVAGTLSLIRNRSVAFHTSLVGGKCVLRNNFLVTGNVPWECGGA